MGDHVLAFALHVMTPPRTVGFDDEYIVEVLALLTLNLFTNYIIVVLDMPVGSPKVKLNPPA